MHLPAATHRALGASLALALLVPAAAQAHTTRYASPDAFLTTGACSVALPCRIDYAVNGASDGDEVVVEPGSYTITDPLDAPDIDLHGEAGQPAPELAGVTDLSGDVLTFRRGGTLRHLSLSSDSPSRAALHLEGGLAEDLTISALTGDGAEVATSNATTVLRDSVVIAKDTGSSGDALLLIEGSGGTSSLAVRNVTALARTDAAVRCEAGKDHQATLVNVIARGGQADVDATSGEGCSAEHSSLRPASSPSLSLGAGIQTDDPKLGVDQRPKSDSPTIDTGVADAHTTAADPDGTARTVPDIGAYEGVPDPEDAQGEDEDDQGEDGGTPAVTAAASPTPTTAPADPVQPPVHGVPAPVLGQTVVIAPGQGKVLVRRPGAKHFRELGEAALLPSGTVVDARGGRIRLTTALDATGEFQTGRFWGSRFKIRQSAAGGGMTSLLLRGGSFARCPARASGLAHASGVARENPTTRRVVRSLWARDHGGRFRTYGNNSVATARGTAWVTRDRCDGTVTRVREGAVAVKNRRTGRTVVVRAGGAYLAKR